MIIQNEEVLMSQFEFIDKRVPIALDNPSIYHDISKCKNCTLCRRACADVMSVLDYYDLESTGDVPMCIHCGQCAAACPFDSMHAKSELDKVKAAIADPDKIVVIQTAPAVRVAIGEGFGYEPGTFLSNDSIHLFPSINNNSRWSSETPIASMLVTSSSIFSTVLMVSTTLGGL